MLVPLERVDAIVARVTPCDRILCGVYFLIRDGSIVYVGQSVDIRARVGVHTKDGHMDFSSWAYIECLQHQLNFLESAYIHALQPALNRSGLRKGEKHAPMRVAEVQKLLAVYVP